MAEEKKLDAFAEAAQAIRNAGENVHKTAEALAELAHQQQRMITALERLRVIAQTAAERCVRSTRPVQQPSILKRAEQLCVEATRTVHRVDAHLTVARLSEDPRTILKELAKARLSNDELRRQLAIITKEFPDQRAMVEQTMQNIAQTDQHIEELLDQANERAPDIPSDVECNVDAELKRILSK